MADVKSATTESMKEKSKGKEEKVKVKVKKEVKEKKKVKRKFLPAWNMYLEIPEDKKFIFLSCKPEYNILEEYWVNKPFSKVKIVSIPSLGDQIAYFVEEVELSEKEKKAAEKLIDILSIEMRPPAAIEENVKEYVEKEAKRLINKYKKAIRGLSEESWGKVIYYIKRDLLGFGPINVMMTDPMLEDISCDGVDRSIYVWHRKYESIPSNLIFLDKDYLREFIIKLAHIAGKHISAAFPVVDAILPGGHRLAATYGEEISPRGSTFTIRKFREKPYSIIELIKYGTLNPRIAAYLWLMLEHRMTMMIIGGTAAGKTTLLNVILNFVKPSYKIVTVEETPELNVPHENWVQMTTRESYGLGETKSGEIGLYDLVRLSLRYRPDYIIVGEIRGREAFVLFQAMATGHGGLSTLHADSIENAVRRLKSKPMNVAEAYIPMLNIIILISKVPLPNHKFGRRVLGVWEVEDYNKYIKVVEWDPSKDIYYWSGSSYLLNIISKRTGVPIEKLFKEIEVREKIILWMIQNNIIDIREVAKVITRFYTFPKKLIEKVRLIEIKPINSKSSSSSISSRSLKLKEPKTEVFSDKVESKPSALSDIQLKFLSLLKDNEGGLDYSTLSKKLSISENELWKVSRALLRNKYIKLTKTYINGRPKIGFQLTEIGEKYLDKEGEAK